MGNAAAKYDIILLDLRVEIDSCKEDLKDIQLIDTRHVKRFWSHTTKLGTNSTDDILGSKKKMVKFKDSIKHYNATFFRDNNETFA
jgi:hypothetical protein